MKNTRSKSIIAIFLVLILVLTGRLFSMSVLQKDDWSDVSEAISIKTINTPAQRGEILDRNGKVLAGNTLSFTVQFSQGNLSAAELNAQALQLMDILEKNGDKAEDSFPIVFDQTGHPYYTYQKKIEEWLEAQDMPKDFTARRAFDELLSRNGIEAADEFEAQAKLQNAYGIFPPISVKLMKFTEEMNRDAFLQRYNLPVDTPPYEAFCTIRDKFKISPDLSNSEVRKILIVRDLLSAQGYMSYVPVTVAKNISNASIVTINERSMELSACQVVQEYVRTYPYGESAGHIIGYLGKISESNKAEYLEKGYSLTDLVGQDGIEAACEDRLRGTSGVQSLEVNALGKRVKTLGNTPQQKGENVYLTLDIDLQQTAEDALARTLKGIQTGGTFESEYGDFKFTNAYKNATTGAAVALDVQTGEVLASASYPSFDPNLFAKGITNEDWDSLQAENPRDPLSPRPLYNIATKTAVQPGSTFKMVTATAALEAGLNPNMRLRDAGYIKIGDRTYGCVVWNRYRGNHGLLNLTEAIEVSCNYYFYDIITDKDWATGKSLGLKTMSIEKVMDYAREYGLGEATGIEIPETVVPVPSEERKEASYTAMLRIELKNRAREFFEEETFADKEKLNEVITEISGWTKENPTRAEILRRFAKLPVRRDKQEELADLCKYTYFEQATWITGDYFNLAIGQGENAYTPLQMANYVATIGNKGKRNQVNVIYGIGREKTEKPEPTAVSLSDPRDFEVLLEGMRKVTHSTRGSGVTLFNNFPVPVGAKTGTAEKSGKINPPDEIEYLKEHLRQFNSGLTWEEVEAEAARLLREESDVYTSHAGAARRAIINLSGGKVSTKDLDSYKEDYENFSWFVALAPIDDPQIAVAVLISQGGTGGYGAPAAREIIGKYLGLKEAGSSFSDRGGLTK